MSADDDDGREAAEGDSLLGTDGDDSLYAKKDAAAARAEQRRLARRGFWLVVLAGTVWGGGALGAKLMDDPTRGIPEYLVIRTGTISLCQFLMALSQRESRRTLGLLLRPGSASAKEWAAMAVVAVCMGCGMSMFVISLAFVAATNTLCIMAAGPFVAAFLERLFLQQRLERHVQIAMTAAAIGVVVIGSEGLLQQDAAEQDNAAVFIGNLCAMGVAVLSASASTALVALKDLPGGGLVSTMVGTLGVAVTALCWTLLDEDEGGMWFVITRHNSLCSLFVGLCIGVGLVFYNLGAVHVTAAQMQILQMTEVVSGILLVMLLKLHDPDKGEIPTLPATVGGLLICGAITFQGHHMREEGEGAPG